MGFTVIVEGEIACVNRMTLMLRRGEAVYTENNAGGGYNSEPVC